jgi:hypothetical protein
MGWGLGVQRGRLKENFARVSYVFRMCFAKLVPHFIFRATPHDLNLVLGGNGSIAQEVDRVEHSGIAMPMSCAHRLHWAIIAWATLRPIA